MYYTTLGNRLLDKGNHKPGNPKILQCASRSQAASDISILYKLLFEVCHRDFKAHIRKCLFYVRENQPGGDAMNGGDAGHGVVGSSKLRRAQ